VLAILVCVIVLLAWQPSEFPGELPAQLPSELAAPARLTGLLL
jgi:hypothetical protein